jgi:hypothetical protein
VFHVEQIKVLHIPVGKPPEVKEIKPSLKIFKELIGGGHLEMFAVSPNRGIVGYCDEEGALKGLPANFSLYGHVRVGDVVLFKYTGAPTEASLTKDDVKYIKYIFSNFLRR